MRELRQQLLHALLAVITVAAVIAAVLNFQQQGKFRLPVDGATWVDRGDHPVAEIIDPESPAAKSGIRKGDALISIAAVPVGRSSDAMRILATLGPWHKAEYRVLRNGYELP